MFDFFWWRSLPPGIRLALQWLLLVWGNAVISFYLGLTEFNEPAHILGMVAGVFTFVYIYWQLDILLLHRGYDEWRRALVWGVSIKLMTQFWPMIELVAGVLALQVVGHIDIQSAFLNTYLMTLLVGLSLSLFAALITTAVRGIRWIWLINK